MKPINFFKIAVCAAAMAFAGSCTNPEETVDITFPEATDHEIEIDEQIELTFEAEAAWKLTIDQTWLVFVDGGETYSQLTGPAGTQTVTLTTVDVTSIFDEAEAVVKIEMNGQIETLFNVTRLAEQRKALMFDTQNGTTYEAGATVYLDYPGNGQSFFFTFGGNFDWKVVSVPDWAEFDTNLQGQPRETANMADGKMFSIKKEYLPFAQQGSIVVSDMSVSNTFTFNLTYVGMPEDEVVITNAEGRTPGVWSNYLTFSADDDATQVVSVLAKNLEYSVIVAEYSVGDWGNDIYSPDCDWVHINNTTSGTLTISVDNNTGDRRTAMIWVLPAAKAPAADTDIDEFWFSSNYKEEYMFAIEQAAAASLAPSGVVVAWTAWQSPLYYEGMIPCTPFEQYDFDGLTLSEFGTQASSESIYVYELPETENIVGNLSIASLDLPAEGWSPMERYRAFNAFGASNFYVEPTNFSFGSIYENMYTAQGERAALTYSETAMLNAKPGMLVIELYNDDFSMEVLKPSAALILVKK